MSSTVILFFASKQHYQTASLVGKAPTPGTELSSSPGVASLAHPEIADLKGLSQLLFWGDQ